MNFVDYYEMLQISPNAQIETINRVYKMLAQRFHPDNPESADTGTLPEAAGRLRRPVQSGTEA